MADLHGFGQSRRLGQRLHLIDLLLYFKIPVQLFILAPASLGSPLGASVQGLGVNNEI